MMMKHSNNANHTTPLQPLLRVPAMILHIGLIFCTALLGITTPGNAEAQLYKWVGADGKVTYSDTPPPTSAKQLNTKASNSGGSSSAPLPFELAAAVTKNPVTLYTFAECTPCNDGRALLKKRGVPFTEKTIKTSEDSARLKQISAQEQLPLLIISNSKFTGFDNQQWEQALSQAGYPETSRLPKDYVYPTPEPAAPLAEPKPDEVKKDVIPNKPVPKPQPPKKANDAGIRF
jgi:glutaredoxin